MQKKECKNGITESNPRSRLKIPGTAEPESECEKGEFLIVNSKSTMLPPLVGLYFILFYLERERERMMEEQGVYEEIAAFLCTVFFSF